jgi:hypothetical protein
MSFDYDNPFNTEVNYDYMGSRNPISNAIATLFGGVAASVVDVGATLWNSLPGTPEYSTGDILERIGGDPLRVYNEHRDAVQIASLVGGAFIPGTLAIKSLNYARAGVKTANWFSKAGETARRQELVNLLAAGPSATKAYKQALWANRGTAVGNAAADTIAAEALVLGMMSAHPYLEDYWEDPVKNVGMSLLLGGGLGAVGGLIVDRAAVKGLLGAADAAATQTVFGALRYTAPDMPGATLFHENAISIANLNKILDGGKVAKRTAENDLTMQKALDMRKALEMENEEVFKAMLSPELAALPAQELNALKAKISADARFHAVDSIRSYSPKEALARFKAAPLADDPVIKKTTLDPKTGDAKTTFKEAVFFPEEDSFGVIADIQHHAGASVLGKSANEVAKKYADHASYTPNPTNALELMGKSTAHIQEDSIAWTLKFSKMDDAAFEKHLSKSLLASDDLPQLEALVQRIALHPNKAALKIKIADKADEAASILSAERRTVGGTPLKYQEAAQKMLNNQTVDQLYGINDLARGWIGGTEVHRYQKSAVNYFAKGYSARSRSTDDLTGASLVRRMYEDPRSVQLRADLATNLADKDGMIYLFRGQTTASIKGAAPLESMAVTTSKASQFAQGAKGSIQLYKVHVDDVVGAVVDVGNYGDNVELIVRASARQSEATLDAAGKIKYQKEIADNLGVAKAKAFEADSAAALNFVLETKHKHMLDMIRAGYPVGVIAKRVNMPNQTVEAFLATDTSLSSLTDLLENGNMSAFRFQSAADAAAALDISKRPIVLKGNPLKNDYTKAHANMNTATVQQINELAIGKIMSQSISPLVQDIHKLVSADRKDAFSIIRAQISKINTYLMGSPSVNSLDQVFRKMDDVGVMLNHIGKETVHFANNHAKRLLEPVAKAMAKIKDDDIVSLTELAVAQNLNAGLKGYRIYKDRQFWQVEKRVNLNGDEVEVLIPVKFREQEFRVQSPYVDEILRESSRVGRELYESEDVRRKILGQASINNTGFWFPSVNPIGKHIAYVHDPLSDTTRMLYGKTADELEEAIAIVTATELPLHPSYQIVRKGDQKWWSLANGRTDTINMEAADVSRLKTGSAQSATLTLNRSLMTDIVQGYEHYINAATRNLLDVSVSDITDSLRRTSEILNKNYDAQPLNILQRVKQKPKDPAKAALNALLGNPLLGEYEGWTSLSKSFEWGLSTGIDVMRGAWKAVGGEKFRLGKDKLDWDKISATMNEGGVKLDLYEFVDQDAFVSASKMSDPEVSKRLVAATNGVTATLALRFGEIAHPLVNLMSMPIMNSLYSTKAAPSSFMGISKSLENFSVNKAMIDGVRSMNSSRFAGLNKQWEDRGYFTPIVSEATKALQYSRKFERGALPAVENALDSSFVTMMSKPSDLGEELSRRIAMHTGYQLGKRLYPGLGDDGLTIFARDFMDKTLGNYSAAQRPVAFQGTLGMAMGLFQTYMLTMAQAIYRNVEVKDWKTIAKGMLAQQTIFGAASLPGFSPVSTAIGEHFSNEHYDLKTGTFRALGDEAADWLLYGLPSNITQAGFYTRGDIAPRPPNVLGGLENIVGVNMGMQAVQAVRNLAGALGEGENAGQAVLQALSMQSLSRPIARNAETLAAMTSEGGAINQAERTIQNSEEVFNFVGISSRLMSLRPMQEAKLREMDHMNRYYQAADKERRMGVIQELRTAIRTGTNSPEKIEKIAEQYMRFNGSPAGWRSAFRQALETTNARGVDTFAESLREDSPLNAMISSLN